MQRDWLLRQHLYRHFDKDGRLLYVGISLNAVARLGGHRASSQWFGDIARVDIEVFPDRKSVEEAERNAIRQEKPIWNKAHATKTPAERDAQRRAIAVERGRYATRLGREEADVLRPALEVWSARLRCAEEGNCHVRILPDGRYRFRLYTSGTKRGPRRQVTLPAGTSFEDAKRIARETAERVRQADGISLRAMHGGAA